VKYQISRASYISSHPLRVVEGGGSLRLYNRKHQGRAIYIYYFLLLYCGTAFSSASVEITSSDFISLQPLNFSQLLESGKGRPASPFQLAFPEMFSFPLHLGLKDLFFPTPPF